MLCCGFYKKDDGLKKKKLSKQIFTSRPYTGYNGVTSMFYLTGCLDKYVGAGGDDLL